MKLLFFFSLFMIFYVYLGYPMLIALIGLIRNKKVKKGPHEPTVTILIAAYNEQEVIENTLKNKLDLDYPKDKLDIIVISDGSTDKTDEIVRKYDSDQVRLIRQEPRAGKTSALNIAVHQAKGETLCFSDANSIWDKGALRHLVQNFNDPSVGYVTGKMVYTNPDDSVVGDGCTAYMKYENLLRKFETGVGSVVGVDGGIDAVRTMLYQPMNPDQLPDFVLPLKVVDQGYRVVYEPEAILKEGSLEDAKDEYRMRVRVALRSFWALSDMRHLLSVRKYKLFAVQLWFHKILRYLCFVFLILAYLSNLSLYSIGPFFKLFLMVQTGGYVAAFLSAIFKKWVIHLSLPRLFHYFALINMASAHAFVKFLLGKKQVTWTPRKG